MRADVVVQVVPVVVLQLLGDEVDPADVVGGVVGRLQPVAVVDAERRVRVPRPVARHRDRRALQHDLVEDAPDRQQILVPAAGRLIGQNNQLPAQRKKKENA